MTLKSQIERFSINETNFNSVITGSSGVTVDLGGGAGAVKTLASAIDTIQIGNDRGAWTTATAYAINDVVLESGAYYRCPVAHTSGVFATDLASGKWRLNQGGDTTILTHRGRLVEDVITARFSTVTAMIADVNLVVGDVVETFANQNGAAINQKWEIVANGAGVNDGGSFIDLSGSGLQAKQIFDNTINVAQFGADSSGVLDSTDAHNLAAIYCKNNSKKLIADGSHVVTDVINLRHIELDYSMSHINVAHAGIGVLIGGNASSPDNPTQVIGSVARTVGTDSTSTPTVRIIGAKGQHITVNSAAYVQLYADTHSIGETTERNLDYSIAYSTFIFKNLTTVELTNNSANAGGAAISGPGGTVQWINENKIYLNRATNVLINGTYTHNHNKFYDGALESTATINLDTGYDNQLLGLRLEGTTTITLGASTKRCVIEKSWSSSENIGGIWSQVVAGTVTDLGEQNQIFDQRSNIYARSLIAYGAISDPCVNNRVGVNFRRNCDLQRIYSNNNGNNALITSDKIPVIEGDEIEFWVGGQDSGSAQYRPALIFYDKNNVIIADPTGFVASSTINTVSGTAITVGTGISTGRVRMLQYALENGAVYCKCEIRSSFNQQSGWIARRMEIRRYSKYLTSNTTAEHYGKLIAVSAIPTQGFVPLGYMCIDTAGSNLYICTLSVDTLLNGAVLSGATSITVDDATAVAINDIVGINQSGGSTHWTTVSNVAGTTITLTSGVTADCGDNARVVFSRFVTK